MAYDEAIAERVRECIAQRVEPEEIKMFGGLCFMVNTHLAVGVTGGGLLLRVGRESVGDAIERGATQALMGERAMTGVVHVAAGLLDGPELEEWVLPAVEGALALPPKPPKKPKRKGVRD